MKRMGSQHERAERIQVLRGLIERLCAPDLTLSEAKVLRGRLSSLLPRDDEPTGWGRSTAVASRVRDEGSRHDDRWPGISMRAAG